MRGMEGKKRQIKEETGRMNWDYYQVIADHVWGHVEAFSKKCGCGRCVVACAGNIKAFNIEGRREGSTREVKWVRLFFRCARARCVETRQRPAELWYMQRWSTWLRYNIKKRKWSHVRQWPVSYVDIELSQFCTWIRSGTVYSQGTERF